MLRKIVEPSGSKITAPAVVWGQSHEPAGRKAVQEVLGSIHSNLTIRECGLFVSPEHQYLAASPDCVIECECCGTHLLEVTCPYSLREKSPREEIAHWRQHFRAEGLRCGHIIWCGGTDAYGGRELATDVWWPLCVPAGKVIFVLEPTPR